MDSHELITHLNAEIDQLRRDIAERDREIDRLQLELKNAHAAFDALEREGL